MNTRWAKAVFTLSAVMICVVVLSGIFAASASAQGISLGAKGGILSGEFSVFTEAFLANPVSVSLGLGVQSGSLSISAWTTFYVLPSTQLISPYVALGAKVLVLHSGPQVSLMLLGGVRVSPIRLISLFVEAALLTRLPDFDSALDVRVGLAVRF